MNNALGKEKRLDVPEDQQYLMRDGQRYLLYDRTAEEVSNLVPLDKTNVLGDAREKMQNDLEAGFVPYLVIKKEYIESVMKNGLNPSSGVNQFVVQDDIWGKKTYVAENNNGVFFNLNRKIDLSGVSPDDYVVVLKDLEGFDPKMDIRKGVHYYMHMIGTMQAVSPDKLMKFRVSEINLDPNKTVEVPVNEELVNETIKEIKEEVEEYADREVFYWRQRLDNAVFESLKMNALFDFKTELYDIASTPRSRRERPYDTWESDDFVRLEESLEDKIAEVRAFVKACKELERTVRWFDSLTESKRKWELEALAREDEEDFDFVSELYDNGDDLDGSVRYYLVSFRKRAKNEGKSEAYIKKFEDALNRYYDFVILS